MLNVINAKDGDCGLNYNCMSKQKKQSSKSIKQHWVSKFYFKEFAIPETTANKNPQAWIFSRHEGDPQKVSITGIASKRYLYSPKNEKGERSWKIEDKLAHLESTVAAFWPRIARGYVDLDAIGVRKGLSLFISTLLLRHPSQLDEYREIRDQLTAFFNSISKNDSGEPNISHMKTPTGVFPFDTSGWFKFQHPTEYDRHQSFVDQIERSAIETASLLMKKRWSIIVSERPCFITTDKPVTVFHPERQLFGLATNGTIITFPLSPTRILILDDQFSNPASQYYPLPKNDPAPFNIIHWIHAHEFMVSHRHPDEVNYEMVSYEDKNKQLNK
ncbi:MAG: DUF4238 domain-containing protein [Dissulfurispiraceae bacterium]